MGLFTYANLLIDARCWEARKYKKNRKLSGIYTLTHRVRFCLHQKQRRRVLTEKHLSITLGICELSFIKLTLWLPSLLWSTKKVTPLSKHTKYSQCLIRIMWYVAWIDKRFVLQWWWACNKSLVQFSTILVSEHFSKHLNSQKFE